MAAPHVAGAAALVMSLGVSAPGAVEDLLRSTAQDPPESSSERYGSGLLDAAAAVRQATEKPGPAFWAGLVIGSGALAMLAPTFGERIPLMSFLALPPAAWPQRFLTPWAGYAGWSALVPFILALLARLSARPLQNAFGAAVAGLAFGWAGTLLHAALWRPVALPWMPSLLMPFWLLASALVAWVAGRGLLARESLR